MLCAPGRGRRRLPVRFRYPVRLGGCRRGVFNGDVGVNAEVLEFAPGVLASLTLGAILCAASAAAGVAKRLKHATPRATRLALRAQTLALRVLVQVTRRVAVG